MLLLLLIMIDFVCLLNTKTALHTFCQQSVDFLAAGDDQVLLLSAVGFNTSRLNLKKSIREHQELARHETCCEVQLHLESSLLDTFVRSANVTKSRTLNGFSSLPAPGTSIGSTTASVSRNNTNLPTFMAGVASSSDPVPSIFTPRIFTVTSPPLVSLATSSSSQSQNTVPSSLSFLHFQPPPNS